MTGLALGAGLSPRFPTPPLDGPDVVEEITEEAGITAPRGQTVRVTPLVEEGAVVAQGAPVAALRDAGDVLLVAPMPAKVALIRLLPGRKLSEIVLFREAGGDRRRFEGAPSGKADLRTRLQQAGLWSIFRRRPFGGMPPPGDRPAAIVVMAADTRPLAPDPRRALEGQEEAFARGLDALAQLTEGPVLVCQRPGPALFDKGLAGGRVRAVSCGARHPQGLAGIRVHDLAPATIEAPVWDVHAEDVAALGGLLETGYLPETRLVHVAGEGLRESRLVRTQPGADLRGLTRRVVQPAPHVLLSGSPLDGTEAHWLRPRDRQVTVMPRPPAKGPEHWLVTALTRTARPKPIIPTAALTQAFGGAVPAAAFVRALASGDDELAMKLGILSFLEEDMALADYVLAGEAHLADLLRAMLDRIQAEFDP